MLRLDFSVRQCFCMRQGRFLDAPMFLYAPRLLDAPMFLYISAGAYIFVYFTRILI
jgi:hypothetical protein